MSFITPLFLTAALTVVVPILLHLVKRQKTREASFSTHMFLDATPIQRIRRRWLQDIILMMIRSVLLILLAILFARPFIPPDKLPLVPDAGRESGVILLDVSYSMQYDSRFDEALEQARMRLTTENEWAIVRFNDAAEQLTPLGADLSIHEAALRSQSATYRRTDLHPALQLGTEILKSAKYESRRMIVISDFQQSAFSQILENLRLPDDITIEPIKVGQDAFKNQFFEDVQLHQERRGDLTSIQFNAQIPLDGTVRLYLDEDEYGLYTGHTPTFQQLTERSGLYMGYLEADDAVPGADDRHYFTYFVQPRPSIFVVDASIDMRNAFFLESAFDLQEVSRYSFDAGPSPTRLNNVDLLVVTTANSSSLRDDSIFENFARNGGTVLLAFDEGPLFKRPLLGVGIVNDVVRARDRQGTEAIIAEIDDQHPIFTPLTQQGTGSILRPQFRRYIQMAMDSTAHVLASLDTGDPLLIERPLGQGRILVFTSSLGTAWNDLALSELFLPLLYEIARYAAPEWITESELTIGDPVTFRGMPGEKVTIADPNGDIFTTLIDSTGQVSFENTELPGHYDARLGGERQPFSVNISPLESDLSARDVEEIYAALANQPSESILQLQPLEVAEKEQKLWKIVLLAIIGIFVLESILASRRKLDVPR